MSTSCVDDHDYYSRLQEEQDAAVRTHALSLLKSKLKRTRVAKQSGSRTQAAHNDVVDASVLHSHSNSEHNHVVAALALATAAASAALRNEAKAAMPIAEEQPESCSPPRSVSIILESDCSPNNNGDLEPTIEQLKQRMTTAVVLESARKSTHSRSSGSRPHSREHASCVDSGVPAPPPPIDSSAMARTRGGGASHDTKQPKAVLAKLVVKWSCTTCKRECIPIREESRCLCGHRYKEHPSSSSDPRVKSKDTFRAFACTSAKCACRAFFYVVAEGAWILRCRCKHKHTDHDPSRAPFGCTKPKCSCAAFDSPWICNCNHAWASHTQEVVEKTFQPLELLQQQFELQELNNVQRTDLLAEPLVHASAVTHSTRV